MAGLESQMKRSEKLVNAKIRAISVYIKGREPVACESDVALLMLASGSLDIFLT